MTIAVGTSKKVAYKVETTFGSAAGTPSAGAQFLRRVPSGIELAKDSFQSAEIRTDFQVADMRHGLRRVQNSLKDELCCASTSGMWKDFMTAITRNGAQGTNGWVAGTAVTTGAITTLTATAPVGTTPGFITFTVVNLITLGFMIGDIVKMTGWTAGRAANNGCWLVLNVTATVLTIAPMTAGSGPLAAGTGDTVTTLRTTSKNMVPLTGHRNDSFTIEQGYTDIGVYEQFLGCRLSFMDVQIPAGAMSTIEFGVMGQNVQSSGSPYFTNQVAAPTTGVMAGPNGVLMYKNNAIGLVTAANFRVDAGSTVGAVVGSVQTPDVFQGRIRCTGQLSIYFQDSSIRDDFWVENTFAVAIALASDAAAVPASMMGFVFPQVKLSGFTRADAEQAIIGTAPFTALLNPVTTGEDTTTFSIQDSTF